MERIADAARFVRRLETVAHRGELWSQLKDIAAQDGFSDLTVFRAAMIDGPEVSLIHNDTPTSALKAFHESGGGIDHPLVALALTQLEPFSITDAARVASNTVRQCQALASLLGTLDAIDGWTVPVACSEQVRGVVVFAGHAPDMSPLVCSTLHLLAHLAFRKSDEIKVTPLATGHGLTAREIECLRWVARGKTDAEIAVILSIRPRTARFHIENAKRKLGVAKRIHAVAEALRIRAIAA